jgi:hypothetical protein
LLVILDTNVIFTNLEAVYGHPPILIDWAMQCHWQSKNTNKYCWCTISAVGPSNVLSRD